MNRLYSHSMYTVKPISRFRKILMTITNPIVKQLVNSTVFVMFVEYCLNRCGWFPYPAWPILTLCYKWDTYICVPCNPQDEPVPRSKRTIDQSKTSCLLHLHVDYLFYQRFGSIEAVVAQVKPKIQYTQVIQPKCNLDIRTSAC